MRSNTSTDDGIVLSIRDVTFAWTDNTLLNDLSATLAEGEVVFLKGENGSGKSTLLRLISGAIPHFSRGRIQTGNIDFRGISVFDNSPKHFFPSIAYIPGQHLEFFLFGEELEQEIALTQAINHLESSYVAGKLACFRSIFPVTDESQSKICRQYLSLLFIYYLQGAALYLLDEADTLPEEHFQRFLKMIQEEKRSAIFTGHRFARVNCRTWILSEGKLRVC